MAPKARGGGHAGMWSGSSRSWLPEGFALTSFLKNLVITATVVGETRCSSRSAHKRSQPARCGQHQLDGIGQDGLQTLPHTAKNSRTTCCAVKELFYIFSAVVVCALISRCQTHLTDISVHNTRTRVTPFSPG